MSEYMAGPNDVAATLTLTLHADSGYTADAEYRVSANQWGVILKVAEGKVSLQQIEAAPELLEMLQWVMKTHSMVSSERRRIEKVISKAAGEQL